MRRCLSLAVPALALSVLVAAAPAGAGTVARAASRPGPPAVHAVAATLYDPGGHRFLWSDHPDLEVPVASLTKLMTAWLALQQPGSTPVTVGSDVIGIPQTTAGLVPGRTYTLGSLLPLLIVRSANDAAVAIADALAGSVPAFVARMNAEAAAMGLTDTSYVDPNGLDATGQHSSARDVAELAGQDMGLPAFRQLAALRTATLPGGATFTDENPFLGAYPGANGVKTGFTSTAGFCLAASATQGGHLLIAVVLGEPSWGRAVADASALLTWGFLQEPAAAGAPDSPQGQSAAHGLAQPANGSPASARAVPPSRAAAAAATVPPPGAAQPASAAPATARPRPPTSGAAAGQPGAGTPAGGRTLSPPPRRLATSPRPAPAAPATGRLPLLVLAAIAGVAVAGSIARRWRAGQGR